MRLFYFVGGRTDSAQCAGALPPAARGSRVVRLPASASIRPATAECCTWSRQSPTKTSQLTWPASLTSTRQRPPEIVRPSPQAASSRESSMTTQAAVGKRRAPMTTMTLGAKMRRVPSKAVTLTESCRLVSAAPATCGVKRFTKRIRLSTIVNLSRKCFPLFHFPNRPSWLPWAPETCSGAFQGRYWGQSRQSGGTQNQTPKLLLATPQE
jgi:hypothetical protein